jgi:hypothetical protein
MSVYSAEMLRLIRTKPAYKRGTHWLLRCPGSNGVKERETPENVETRLVMGTGFLWHTLQYGQMRWYFRP